MVVFLYIPCGPWLQVQDTRDSLPFFKGNRQKWEFGKIIWEMTRLVNYTSYETYHVLLVDSSIWKWLVRTRRMSFSLRRGVKKITKSRLPSPSISSSPPKSKYHLPRLKNRKSSLIQFRLLPQYQLQPFYYNSSGTLKKSFLLKFK